MGRSGDPRKRTQKAPRMGRQRRDAIGVDVDTSNRLVVVDVGGEQTGMTAETADQFALSLSQAAKHVRSLGG